MKELSKEEVFQELLMQVNRFLTAHNQGEEVKLIKHIHLTEYGEKAISLNKEGFLLESGSRILLNGAIPTSSMTLLTIELSKISDFLNI